MSNSQDAYIAGNAARAQSEALAAKAIEPWAASPYLQLGFIAEAEGHFTDAARWAHEAIRHSRRDWILWASAANFETEGGDIRAAIRDYAEARRLNPHSTVLAPPKSGGG